MIFDISDKYQQYSYQLEVNDVRELKHVKLTTKYQGAKFPDAIQTKVELFLHPSEWLRLKAAINSVV